MPHRLTQRKRLDSQNEFFLGRFNSSETLCHNCPILENALRTPLGQAQENLDRKREKSDHKRERSNQPAHFQLRTKPLDCPPCLAHFFQETPDKDRFKKAKWLYENLDSCLRQFADAPLLQLKTYFLLAKYIGECQTFLKQTLPQPVLPVPSLQKRIIPKYCPHLAQALQEQTIYLVKDVLHSQECLRHTIGSAVIFHSFLGLLLLSQKTKIVKEPRDLSNTLQKSLSSLLDFKKSAPFAQFLQIPLQPRNNIPIEKNASTKWKTELAEECQQISYVPLHDNTEEDFKKFLAFLKIPEDSISHAVACLKNENRHITGILIFKEVDTSDGNRNLTRFFLTNPFCSLTTNTMICRGQALFEKKSTKKAKLLLETKITKLIRSNPDPEYRPTLRIFFSQDEWQKNKLHNRVIKYLAKIYYQYEKLEILSDTTKIEPFFFSSKSYNKIVKEILYFSYFSDDILEDTQGLQEQGVRCNILNDAYYILDRVVPVKHTAPEQLQQPNTPLHDYKSYMDNLKKAFDPNRLIPIFQKCLDQSPCDPSQTPPILSKPSDTQKQGGKNVPTKWYKEAKDDKDANACAFHNVSRYIAVAFATYKFLTEKEFTITSGDIRECSRLLYRQLRDNFAHRKTKSDAKFHRRKKYSSDKEWLKAVVIDGPIFPLPKKQKRRKTDESEK